MPELPEVETTRRGLQPHLLGRSITRTEILQPRLRWEVPPDLGAKLGGREIVEVGRRGKYLLLRTSHGTLIIHLGMSGSLRIATSEATLRKHDHAVFSLDSGERLIFHDPRRFGALLWSHIASDEHPLLRSLGPEPFDPRFHGGYLYQLARKRRCTVKTLIMNQRWVVGVGNIYANESLFIAGIRPDRQAQNIARKRYQKLAETVRQVLTDAIAQGGTTLRDFSNAKGQPGYFQLTLQVYGKAGEPCPRCGALIHMQKVGQRATFFCPRCQR